jgi:bifunctional DNase/RNase
MIEMFVTGVALDVRSDIPLVILHDEGRKYTLPIWIGQAEAQAIARGLEGLEMERPMTHDLIMEMIDSMGAVIDSIEINSFEDTTFFASVMLIDANQNTTVVDARPSDAIALALRCEAPIFVAESILEDLNPEFSAQAFEVAEAEEDDLFDTFFTPEAEVSFRAEGIEDGEELLDDWEFKRFISDVKASDFSLKGL